MSESLQSAIAIVTGASSGIGEATATRLVDEGAAVVLVGRRRDRLEALATSIDARSGRALVVEADIARAQAAADVVDTTIAHFGRIDILVNAAGVMLNGDSLRARLDEWDQMVDVNLKGLMYMTKAALPHLLEAPRSSSRRVADVINVSSVAGRAAAPTVAIYNATKFGVTAATESWRQEYARSGIRFSVIEPGAVETELFGHQQQHAQDIEAERFAGVERLLPEDIADAAAYIATSPRRRAVNEVVVRPTDQAA
ncbi:SDR family NAD(P)-dependent oxidoreductase [Actinomycetospora sp. NBRC 106378]|uniref:SDR family NAD(P)-dependent oxidoreductase n=1 Tax=Actinomycetospora sp. NBRC 106378 TaxID=3032208 RepID=UPI0024A27BFA|nr:SDR family NAD(P)-dependent oxidoreductase [Actinomycetospora sp. NBRC 106378]GLZ56373.1 aldehyde dehydrogenase [Actinomycetospora sp. NBRC 106378]